MVGDTVTQILTKKTIIDDNSNIRANSLRSSGATVDISNAAAPTSGQVLTATSGTTATWQTPTSVSSSGYKSFSVVIVTADYFNNNVYKAGWDSDAYVIDYNTITASGYYFDLPSTGMTHLQKIYVVSANLYHLINVTVRDSNRLIYPTGLGIGAHMINFDFNMMNSFTYYEHDMPNASGVTYPCWYWDDTYTNTPIHTFQFLPKYKLFSLFHIKLQMLLLQI